MADERRNNRSGSTGRPGQGGSGRPAAKKAASGGRKPAGQGGKPGSRDGKPASRDGKPSYRDRDDRPRGAKKAAPGRGPKAYGNRRDADGVDRSDRAGYRQREEQVERTADQKAYDGPDLPDFITGKELDRGVAAQLKGLPEKLAARIARHLAAAQHFLEVDNAEIAYQHALAAKSRAQRLAIVREAVGESAYYAGHFDVALAELRAAKRMNGATAYLPMMADCHRALGHPEQALKLAQSPSVRNFAPAQKAEMTIIEAEARAELGQLDAALRTLELAPLMSKSRESWVVRLRYVYADILEQAGKPEEALTWFHRTLAIDAEESTDAGDRAAALESKRA